MKYFSRLQKFRVVKIYMQNELPKYQDKGLIKVSRTSEKVVIIKINYDKK